MRDIVAFLRHHWLRERALMLRHTSMASLFVRTVMMFSVLTTVDTSVMVVYLEGTAVAQWLRCCAAIRKVAGSIPAGVSGFFIDIKSL